MKKIAIVGIGPRGLKALECLYNVMEKKTPSDLPELTLFERTEQAGSGQVWNTEQSEVNWLNISQRALHDLEGRKEIKLKHLIIPAFPSYIEWLPEEKRNNRETDPDLFPARSQMGHYLKERYESIINYLVAENQVKVVRDTIVKLNYEKNQFQAITEKDDRMIFDEIVLTIGHQPTKPSDQLKEWMNHSKNAEQAKLFKKAYPVEEIIESVDITNQSVVGVRGFGLSMIDVARALTVGRGGHFAITNHRTFKSDFKTASGVPKTIIPFSLDGLPLIPKPLNAKIDSWFTPNQSDLDQFEASISLYTSGEREADDITFLIDAISRIAALQYKKSEEKSSYVFEHSNTIQSVIRKWLQNNEVNHQAIYSGKDPVENVISDFIKMAVAEEKFSLDYCVGQVWRHCQPLMYRLFSHAALEEEVMAEIVKLDERMKRYAYGPPVESMQQLLALNTAGILNFNWINDPEIELVEEGWTLEKNGKELTVSVMINSILDSPKLLEVSSPLIKNLLHHDLLEPVHSEMGIKTKKDGCVELKSGKEIPLAVLGRLSKGSVLGVDAILECFRLRIDDWAKGVIKRIINTD